MPQILLLNPSPRPSKRKKKPANTGVKTMAKAKAKRKKPRSAAQKAATRKMIAANRSKKRASKNRLAHVAGYYPNPIKRRKRRANPIRTARVVRRRRRNPINTAGVLGILKPAAIQAGGGLGLNYLMSFVTGYLPAQLQTGPGRSAVELAAAVGISVIGGKFLNRGTARDLAQGAATITLYNLARTTLQTSVPSIGNRLSGVDEMDWEVEGLGWTNNAMTFAPTSPSNNAGVGELYNVGELFGD